MSRLTAHRSVRSKHFGPDRYAILQKWLQVPADDRRDDAHTIIKPTATKNSGRPAALKLNQCVFCVSRRFIMDEIFPGGDLPKPGLLEEHANKAGFELKLRSGCGSLLHGRWTSGRSALEARKDEPSRSSPKRVYDRYNEVPDRLRRAVPRRLYRHLPVHAGEGLGNAPTVGDRIVTAAGASSDTNVRAPALSISAALGKTAARRLPSAGLNARSA